MNYYNENESYCAQWLRNLIAEGLIPKGDVDERSIELVQPADLAGYHQCHFFAGIGGWSLALNLAGFAGECWTGSCPCQPFSQAGSQKGNSDSRHLWPSFRGLIAERRPAICFGEQVASTLGREWFSGLRLDMAKMGYASGAADLCAASVGAPHNRSRLFWVATTDTNSDGFNRAPIGESGIHEERDIPPQKQGWNSIGYEIGASVESSRQIGSCRVRDVPFMADGIPGDMGAIKAYGNAIVPQVAAEFVRAFMECRVDSK